MRHQLDLPENLVAKTIRHTVSSFLRDEEVPGEQISALLGHKSDTDTLERTTEVYAHIDPKKMRSAVRSLTKFWGLVERQAEQWKSDHSLTITPNRHKNIERRKKVKG